MAVCDRRGIYTATEGATSTLVSSREKIFGELEHNFDCQRGEIQQLCGADVIGAKGFPRILMNNNRYKIGHDEINRRVSGRSGNITRKEVS